MKYIDAEKLKAEIERMREINRKALEADHIGPDIFHGRAQTLNYIFEFINSLQQEPTPDTDVLHTELVNLLKTYRIGEETARTIADRIADTYGSQRYMDGLCDGLDEEDTKQEQEKFREKLIEWAKENMDSLGRLSYGEFIDKLNSM